MGRACVAVGTKICGTHVSRSLPLRLAHGGWQCGSPHTDKGLFPREAEPVLKKRVWKTPELVFRDEW